MESWVAVAGTLVGTIVGASLTWAKDWWLRNSEVNRLARYLAVRVVCTLEAFVTSCCEVVNDQGIVTPSGDQKQSRSLP